MILSSGLSLLPNKAYAPDETSPANRPEDGPMQRSGSPTSAAQPSDEDAYIGTRLHQRQEAVMAEFLGTRPEVESFIDAIDEFLLRGQRYHITHMTRMPFLRAKKPQVIHDLSEVHAGFRRPRPAEDAKLAYTIEDGWLTIRNPHDGIDPDAKHVIGATRVLAVAEDDDSVYVIPAKNPDHIQDAAKRAYGEKFDPDVVLGIYRIQKSVARLAFGNDPIRSEFIYLGHAHGFRFSAAKTSPTAFKVESEAGAFKDLKLRLADITLAIPSQVLFWTNRYTDAKLLMLYFLQKGQLTAFMQVWKEIRSLREGLQEVSLRLEAGRDARLESPVEKQTLDDLIRSMGTFLSGNERGDISAGGVRRLQEGLHASRGFTGGGDAVENLRAVRGQAGAKAEEILNPATPDAPIEKQLYAIRSDSQGQQFTWMGRIARFIHSAWDQTTGFLNKDVLDPAVRGVAVLLAAAAAVGAFTYFVVIQDIGSNLSAFVEHSLGHTGFIWDIARMSMALVGFFALSAVGSNWVMGHRRIFSLSGLSNWSYRVFQFFAFGWPALAITFLETEVFIRSLISRTRLNRSFAVWNSPALHRARVGLLDPIREDYEQAMVLDRAIQYSQDLREQLKYAQDAQERTRLHTRLDNLKEEINFIVKLRQSEMNVAYQIQAKEWATYSVLWLLLRQRPEFQSLQPEDVVGIMSAYASVHDEKGNTESKLGHKPGQIQRIVEMYQLLLLKDVGEWRSEAQGQRFVPGSVSLLADYDAQTLQIYRQLSDPAKLESASKRLQRAIALSQESKAFVIGLTNFFAPNMAGVALPNGNTLKQNIWEIVPDFVASEVTDYSQRGHQEYIPPSEGTRAQNGAYSPRFGINPSFVNEFTFQGTYVVPSRVGMTSDISSQIADQSTIKGSFVHRLGFVFGKYLNPLSNEGHAHWARAIQMYYKTFWLRLAIRPLGTVIGVMATATVATLDYWMFYMFVAGPALTVLSYSTFNIFRKSLNNKMSSSANVANGVVYGVFSSWIFVEVLNAFMAAGQKLTDVGFAISVAFMASALTPFLLGLLYKAKSWFKPSDRLQAAQAGCNP
jgi:hypothetical protein